MIRFFDPSNIIAFAFLAGILFPSLCYAETRYALVIGNGKYSIGELTSPMLDADAMEKILAKLNYKVVARKNLTRDRLYKEISKFGELLKKAGSTGFFYYSGHGMQVNGTNYMIPVDLEIATEHDIEEHGVRIDSVISRMNTGKSNPNIIVLDACRNNPFEKRFKNVSTGLAEMKHTPPGMLIAFAAAPGRVARQSPNRLSPYTAELLNQLARANISLIPLFQAAQNGVWKTTDGNQEPRIEISPNLRDIVLNSEKTSIPSSSTASRLQNVTQEDTTENSEFPISLGDSQTRRQAARGNASAQNYIGLMYDSEHHIGRDGPKDDAKAAEWYRKAAERGNANAQYNLGLMYDNGRGVPKDDSKAVEWYRKAAEQGDAAAQNNLGLMYDNGRGVPKDDSKAVEWYRKAAEQGDDVAQYNLGLMYDNGTGVPKDNAKAMEWYRKAAERKNAVAQMVMGHSVSPDSDKALEYRKSAKQGHSKAQTNWSHLWERD